jgi:hypothetical protein
MHRKRPNNPLKQKANHLPIPRHTGQNSYQKEKTRERKTGTNQKTKREKASKGKVTKGRSKKKSCWEVS